MILFFVTTVPKELTTTSYDKNMEGIDVLLPHFSVGCCPTFIDNLTH